MMILAFKIFIYTGSAGAQEGTYIPVSQCDMPSRSVILENNLPLDQIHDCLSKTLPGDGNSINVAIVEYGEPVGCPNNCSYEHFSAVVSGGVVSPLPADLSGKDRLLMSAKLPEWPSSAIAYSCNEILWQNIAKMELEERKGEWGWRVSFTKPLDCTWIQVTQVEFTGDQQNLDSSRRIHRIWDGSMFVSGRPDEPAKWVYDKLSVTEHQEVLTTQGKL